MTRLPVERIDVEVKREDVIRASRRLVLDLSVLAVACAALLALLLPRTYTSTDGLIGAAVLLPIVFLGTVAVRLREHRHLRQSIVGDHLEAGTPLGRAATVVRPRVSPERGQLLSAGGGSPASQRPRV